MQKSIKATAKYKQSNPMAKSIKKDRKKKIYPRTRKKQKKLRSCLAQKKTAVDVFTLSQKKTKGARSRSGRVQLQTNYFGSISQEHLAVRRPHGNRPHELSLVRGNYSSYLPISTPTLLVYQQHNVVYANTLLFIPPLWASLKRRHIVT